MKKMENEENIPNCVGFSGPLTVAEIRKLLSATKPLHMIGRRKSICVSEPSRSIYNEIPEIGVWKKNVNLFNSSFEFEDSFINTYKNDVTIDNNDSVLSKNSFSDSVIVISDDSFENVDVSIKNIKQDLSPLGSFITKEADTDDDSFLQNNSGCSSQNNEFQESKDLSSDALNTSQSTNEDKNRTFNDTLEEMEMLIKQLNYKMTDFKESTNDPPCIIDFPSPIAHETEFKNQFRKFLSAKKKLDAKNLPNNNQIPANSKIAKFKDVVSPVAVYIKNSPHVPHIQNVPVKALQQKNLFPSHKVPNVSNKENELPPVIYVPPRQVLKTTEPSLKLPLSIQHHLPQQPHITKHAGRVVKKDQSHIEENYSQGICQLSM